MELDDAAEQVWPATLSPDLDAPEEDMIPAPGPDENAAGESNPDQNEDVGAPEAPSNPENEAQVEAQDEPAEEEEPGGAEAEADAEAGPKERDITPLLMGRVKKIIRLDKEIKLVSRPALSAITGAARMFMESLASQAFNEMLRNKHKSLRLADLEGAVRRKREYLEFLDDCMEIFTPKKSNNKGESSDEEDEEEAPEINKSKPPPPGTRCITEYFNKNSAPKQDSADELPGEEQVQVQAEDEEVEL